MRIKRVFIDVDDVLNKFTMYALSSVGCRCVDRTNFDDLVYNPTWGFDIVRAANGMLIGTGVKYTKKSFWDNVGRSVWSTTPYSIEFSNIVKNCRILFGKSRVALLTKPIDDPECYAGKFEWIRSRCPIWLRKRHFIGCPKEFLAAADSLLIDDSDKNYDEFIEAGGSAILVPRPWNRLHGYDTEEYLNRAWGQIKLGIGPGDSPESLAAGMKRRTLDEINQ